MKFAILFSFALVACAAPPIPPPTVGISAAPMPEYAPPDPPRTLHPITEEALTNAAPDWIESCVEMLKSTSDDDQEKNAFCFCAHRMFVGNIRKHKITTLEELNKKIKMMKLTANQTQECIEEAVR